MKIRNVDMLVVEDFRERNSEMCWLAKRTTDEDRKEKEKKKFETNERWKETQIDGKQHTKESRSNINIVLLPLVYTRCCLLAWEKSIPLFCRPLLLTCLSEAERKLKSDQLV